MQLQEKRFNKNAKRPPTRIFKGITDERRHSYYVIYATCTNKYAHVAAAQQLCMGMGYVIKSIALLGMQLLKSWEHL